MADTFTGNLKIRKPQTGAYNNTWGATLNSDMMELFDTAITGMTSINVGSSIVYSLPAMSNGAASDSRFFCLKFTGTPGATVVVTLPATTTKKFYLIDNQTGQTMTFKYSASVATVDVATTERRLIWCDGSNCYNVLSAASDASTLVGIPGTNYARRTRTAAEISGSVVVRNAFTDVINSSPYRTVTEAPTTTIDCNSGNNLILTLTGNRTMAAPTNVVDGQEIDLLIVQDATGNRTLTWNSIFQFEGGITPTLGVNPASVDRFKLIYNQALNKWLVGHFSAISAASGATYNLTLSGSIIEFNLLDALGSPGGAITANVTIGPGCTVQSLSNLTPAMDLSGLAGGSTVNLINFGHIMGRGGDGGDASGCLVTNLGGSVPLFQENGRNGQNGGMAIKGPGAGRTFNITNASGFIWGGGGGGGGGGTSSLDGGGGSTAVANGGGGGAGAGGAKGGKGTRSRYAALGANGQDGADTMSGINAVAGTAGVGGTFVNAGGAANLGAAGAGGAYGADGADGVAAAALAFICTPGTKGTAGKAIELSGAGLPTFVSGSGSPNVKGVVS